MDGTDYALEQCQVAPLSRLITLSWLVLALYHAPVDSQVPLTMTWSHRWLFDDFLGKGESFAYIPRGFNMGYLGQIKDWLKVSGVNNTGC